MLKQDVIHTFDSEILLKPWQVPRIAAPLAALLFIFALYGLYQSHSTASMVKTSNGLKVQINQLEARWKPIEQIQTRIAKFQEDQKTLSQFKSEDCQFLELLTFLTQLTPEDTWLTHLSLRQGQLILRGESKSAIKYLSELSKTDGFNDVKFASPITRDRGTDLEKFNVQLQLDMEKLKKSFEALPPETPVEVLIQGPDAGVPAAEKGLLEGSLSPAKRAAGRETGPRGARAMKVKIPKITIADIGKHRGSIAASAIVVTALAAAYFILIAPIAAQKEALDSKIKQQQELIAKYDQKLKQGQSIQDELARHEGDLREMQKKLFGGTDPYQFAASLRDLLSSKGGAEGGNWTSRPTRYLQARSTAFIGKCISNSISRPTSTGCTIYFPVRRIS